MKLKLNIRSKMLLFILTTSILIFAFTIGYISIKNHKLAIEYAIKIAGDVSGENALLIEKSLSENLHVLKTMAEAFSVYTDMPESDWKPMFIDMYKKVYVENPDFYKLWDSWELSFFDTTWSHDYGRYAVTIFEKNNQIEYSTSLRSMEGDAGMYAKIKSIDKNMLWEPYWDEFLEEGEEKKFMTSISAPIRVNGKYAGIVAADIIIDRFQGIVEDINPYEGTNAFLVSNEGVFVGHTDVSLIGKNIKDVLPDLDAQFKLASLVKSGGRDIFNGNNAAGDFILSLAPIQVGDYIAPWSLVLIIPEKHILVEANRTLNFSILVALIGLIILSFIVVLIAQNISGSISKTTGVLEKLSTGDISFNDGVVVDSGDEVQKMSESVNSLLKGLNKTTDFANQIEQGNLNAEFTPLSDKDTLGNALLEMRQSLIGARESEEVRKIDDEKQNWATNGLAKFADILRNNSTDINKLSYSVLSHLIDYMEINQGGLFIAEENEGQNTVFNLAAAVAYGRKKMLNKSITLGEGLIGRCAYEKQTIYITDVPDQYLEITSGMGTANPTMILLVPLLLNDEVHGVLELASFNKLEPYQVGFVETIGESIASTLSSAKISETTSELLNNAKMQADELAAQEEEMRQNLEELQATQEEAIRREDQLQGVVSAINNAAYLIEIDGGKTIISINSGFENIFGRSGAEFVGKQITDVLSSVNRNVTLVIEDVFKGNVVKQISEMEVGEKSYWISETFTPIYNKNTGHLEKIINVGFDVSDLKKE